MQTVFDIAQARLKAVEKMDKIITRQREQAEELERLRTRMSAALLDGTDNLFAAVHVYEGELIRAALKAADRRPCRAALLLGVKPQTLIAKIARHPELKTERSPVYKRKVS